ncbi:MAG: N-acetylmuramoyl-L-alanine amidase, partial [Tissierellia bacterium]|nr:N-acetylmuramoyl-L-alanine amidase [Tissierellia bacterium]
LDVAIKLKRELLVEGYNIIMTREKDESLEELSNIKASRYRRDLDARKTIINENSPSAFVSIHVNSSRKTSARGVKIYHFPGSTEGKRLAENIKESIDEHLYKNYLKEDNLKAEVLTENYYILRETKYPGVLIEIGFITNPEENKLMKSRKYKEKIAYAIKKGVVRFVEPK